MGHLSVITDIKLYERECCTDECGIHYINRGWTWSWFKTYAKPGDEVESIRYIFLWPKTRKYKASEHIVIYKNDDHINENDHIHQYLTESDLRERHYIFGEDEKLYKAPKISYVTGDGLIHKFYFETDEIAHDVFEKIKEEVANNTNKLYNVFELDKWCANIAFKFKINELSRDYNY